MPKNVCNPTNADTTTINDQPAAQPTPCTGTCPYIDIIRELCAQTGNNRILIHAGIDTFKHKQAKG